MQKANEDTEERAIDMIRDGMDFSLVEKYTHLSMTRINEIARELDEAKALLSEGFNVGLQKGQAEAEERAKDMIRDRMELPLVEKYTHLSMPRIQELARSLGML